MEGGYHSRFRRSETDTGDGPTAFPSDVAACLKEYSARVLGWLKDLQRCCGQQTPLIKHDRFVRLCHQVTDHGEPPHNVLALSSPPDADPESGSDADSPAAPSASASQSSGTTAPVAKRPHAARLWAQQFQQAATEALVRRPRLSLMVVLAAVLPIAVWGTWHTLTDVNRAISGVGAGVLALAAARPLLRNLLWGVNTLLGTPVRAGVWVVDTFADTLETDRSRRLSSRNST